MDDQDDSETEVGGNFLTEFAAKDAILEPKTLQLFEKFIELGGDQEVAIEYLSSSYAGVPKMVNLLMQWLHIAGCKQKEIQGMVEDHYTSVILKHFDPKKADHVLIEGGETPTWLEEMIQFPKWRQLLYQLSEQHTECILLKFALKLIRDAGYQDEFVTASTRDSQFDVYAASVVKSLTHVVKAKPDMCDSHVNDFSELASHSQHTYLYTQVILQALSTANDDGSGNPHLAQWLSQQLLRHNMAKGRDVVKTFLHMLAVGTYSRLFEALASMLSRNTLNPADISILYEHYTTEDDSPPVEYLHIPQLLELLVQSLFKPGHSVNPEHKHKYFYILAYAVSVHDAPSSPQDFSQTTANSKEHLDATREALETAHTLCIKATTSHAELQAEIVTLCQAMQYPVVSMGVLRWLEHLTLEPSFFKVASDSYIVYLILLDEIASRHELQHHAVLNLLTMLFEASFPELGAEEQVMTTAVLEPVNVKH
ncbi:negative elongation factor D-like isoform X2 [Dysidea avara]|uniref:negative elongation factor D-like isoform X2 n=1 Tax=Dysidea avara TaxID=196820 RepID=UPI00331D1B9E